MGDELEAPVDCVIRSPSLDGFEIGVHQAFDDDLVFGNVVSRRKKYDVLVVEGAQALTDAAGASSANDNVLPERHVSGGLDLVTSLEGHEPSVGPAVRLPKVNPAARLPHSGPTS